jgi:adenosylcobinamide-phosphate synthase
MGEGRTEADAADIRRALRLYRAACLVQGALAAALLVLVL